MYTFDKARNAELNTWDPFPPTIQLKIARAVDVAFWSANQQRGSDHRGLASGIGRHSVTRTASGGS